MPRPRWLTAGVPGPASTTRSKVGWAAVTQGVWDTSFKAGCAAPPGSAGLAEAVRADAGEAIPTTPTTTVPTTAIIRRSQRPRDDGCDRSAPQWAPGFRARLA